MQRRPIEPETGAHASHDRILVAAHAAGDLAGVELERATSLLQGCPSCRTLHDDLVALALASRSLPAPVRPANLDYRIAPERAAALGRGALWRRLLRPFGRAGGTPVRPLAAAFTTLGLAGLLLATLPSLPLGAAGGSYLATTAGSPDVRDRSSAPEVAPATPVPTDGDTAAGGSQVPPGDTSYGPAASADDKGAQPSDVTNMSGGGQGAGGAPDDGRETGGPAAGSTTPLVILSLGFLAAGLGLLLLRRAALRVR